MKLSAIFGLLLVLSAESCRSVGSGFLGLQPATYPVNFVVWNETDVPQTATVEIDGSKVPYDGVNFDLDRTDIGPTQHAVVAAFDAAEIQQSNVGMHDTEPDEIALIIGNVTW